MNRRKYVRVVPNELTCVNMCCVLFRGSLAVQYLKEQKSTEELEIQNSGMPTSRC